MAGEVLADLSGGYNTLIDHGHGVETAWYPGGEVGVRHTCDRGPKRGTIICAPRLVLNEPNGHTIVSVNPVTISPSCGCSDCGLHGFIRNGRWEPC